VTSQALGPGSVIVSRGRRESRKKDECLWSGLKNYREQFSVVCSRQRCRASKSAFRKCRRRGSSTQRRSGRSQVVAVLSILDHANIAGNSSSSSRNSQAQIGSQYYLETIVKSYTPLTSADRNVIARYTRTTPPRSIH